MCLRPPMVLLITKFGNQDLGIPTSLHRRPPFTSPMGISWLGHQPTDYNRWIYVSNDLHCHLPTNGFESRLDACFRHSGSQIALHLPGSFAPEIRVPAHLFYSDSTGYSPICPGFESYWIRSAYLRYLIRIHHRKDGNLLLQLSQASGFDSQQWQQLISHFFFSLFCLCSLPFCSTRISKVGKCVAFQLWTPTYLIKKDSDNILHWFPFISRFFQFIHSIWKSLKKSPFRRLKFICQMIGNRLYHYWM